MELPHRKNQRLQGYDYSQEGAYFLTICTHNRAQILSRVVGAIHESPACVLTACGETVDAIIRSLNIRYPCVQIMNYVIMPNHIHLILRIITDGRAIRESPLQGKRSTVSKVVGYLKMNASREFRMLVPGAQLWHRGCYDHIIRNEQDYQKIWDYINTNPLRWKDDCFYAE